MINFIVLKGKIIKNRSQKVLSNERFLIFSKIVFILLKWIIIFNV